jgi:hypothetical protein
LRREASELLRRSPWYRMDCRRELLLERRWYGVWGAQPLDEEP